MARTIKSLHLMGQELFAVDTNDHLVTFNVEKNGWDLSFPNQVRQLLFKEDERTVLVLDVAGQIWLRTRTLNIEDENPPWNLLPDVPEQEGVEVELGTKIA